MANKERESAIMRSVYDVATLAEIKEAERPDFHLRRVDHSYYFGVEITELYASQSDARLYRIPEYLNDLLQGKRYRHKDDAAVLEVGEVTFPGSPGQPAVMAVSQPLISSLELSDLLSNRMGEKDKRLVQYASDLKYVDLVVLDQTGVLSSGPVKDIYRRLYSSDVKNQLYRSKFREVYYITLTSDRDWIYVPLKLLLLLAEFHKLKHVFIHCPDELFPNDVSDPMQLFAAYLQWKSGIGYYKMGTNEAAARFEDYWFEFTDQGLKINAYYGDADEGEWRRPDFEGATEYFDSTDFQRLSSEYDATLTLKSELAHELRCPLLFPAEQ